MSWLKDHKDFDVGHVAKPTKIHTQRQDEAKKRLRKNAELKAKVGLRVPLRAVLRLQHEVPPSLAGSAPTTTNDTRAASRPKRPHGLGPRRACSPPPRNQHALKFAITISETASDKEAMDKLKYAITQVMRLDPPFEPPELKQASTLMMKRTDMYYAARDESAC